MGFHGIAVFKRSSWLAAYRTWRVTVCHQQLHSYIASCKLRLARIPSQAGRQPVIADRKYARTRDIKEDPVLQAVQIYENTLERI